MKRREVNDSLKWSWNELFQMLVPVVLKYIGKCSLVALLFSVGCQGWSLSEESLVPGTEFVGGAVMMSSAR